MMLSFLSRRSIPTAPLASISSFCFAVAYLCCVSTQTFAEQVATYSDPLPQRISFQHLLENKDISIGEVQAFLQDSKGFMWIGGSGLLRYDGYEYKPILETVKGDHGIERKPLSVVNAIYEDRDNIIWVATRSGLHHYDPRTELLTPVLNEAGAAITNSTSNTFRVTQVPTGEIVAATIGGLIVVDKKTDHYTAIVVDESKPNGLHSKRLQALFVDDKGVLWIGTEIGLEKMDWATKTSTLIKPYAEHPELVPPNSVNDIVSDKNGGMWLATSNGLVHFDPVTEKTTRYVPDANDPNSISGKDLWALLLDSTGSLWIASDGGGVSIFQKTKEFPEGRFINQKFEAGRPNSISSNQVRSVYEDRIGDIWVGNYPTGINYFDRSSAAISTYTHDESDPNSLSLSAALSMREDSNHNLWIGTDGAGLNFFDRQHDKFIRYRHDEKNEKTLSADSVLSLFLDSDGMVWAGSWGGGISKLNPKTGEVERLPFDLQRQKTASISTSNKLNNAHVWSIKEDSQKNLWIGTHAGGLSKLDRKTGIYTHYQNIDSDPTSISGSIIWDTVEDSKGNLWIAAGNGLDLMDRKTEKFTHFKSDPQDPNSLSNPSVLCILEDSKHRLWLGTEGGLNMMNPDGKTFTSYKKSAGFNNDFIRKILEDNQGRLWLSTNNGVTVFDPETKKVKNYNRVSGRLMGGFYTNSGLVSSRGEIIFGGVEGARIFNTEQLKENKAIPPVAFTGLKIFADAVVVGDKDGLLPQSLNYTKTLTLDYTKSMFQFDFASLNFRDSNKNSYAYKLDGFDKDWLKVGDQRTAKYTNLNAGTYSFRVKASNNDDTWNDVGTSITIIQLPPPWKTWWAYTLYVLVALGLMVWFVMYQRNKRLVIEQQNRILEVRVSERTAELRQKNNDIQAMLENMPQGLFTIQDGEIIHPEYSRSLEDIFETDQIAGRKASELLFSKASLGSDVLDSVVNAMFAIIGEDEMNFSFNEPLLVGEYTIDVNGKLKYLALDWNPILSDDVVNKLMVSVRDITQLKEMESQSAGQKRELDIIGQLIKMSSEKMLGFEESAVRFINENQDAIEHHATRDEEVLALLFRNMHTIKGNCRTYGFTHLSDVVHEVESYYSSLKSSADLPWDQEKLLNDVERVKKGLEEYTEVYRRVLGRGDSMDANHDGFWLSNAVMNKIQTYADQDDFPSLKSYIGTIQAKPIEDVLVDVVASLSGIATQLGKVTPVVKFDSAMVLMKNTSFELMRDIFAHLLRNCVDHGIEMPNERVDANKHEQGQIYVRSMLIPDRLNIFVSDDGRGIDLGRLFRKGVERGIWTEDSTPNNFEIAELIFHSGISTKEVITDISGRGVGLDAVKRFLMAQGGNVQLILTDTKGTPKGFVSFELLISLPKHLYIEVPAKAVSELAKAG